MKNWEGCEVNLFPIQEQVLNALEFNSKVLVCSARQSGKTLLQRIYTVRNIIKNPSRRMAIIMPKRIGAENLLNIIKNDFTELPSWLCPKFVMPNNYQIDFIGNSYSSISLFSQGSINSIRSQTFTDIILDEFDFFDRKSANELLNAVYPVIESTSFIKFLVFGTPNSKPNTNNSAFKRMINSRNMVVKYIHWKDIPGRDRKWKKTMLEILGGNKRTFEYEFENRIHD